MKATDLLLKQHREVKQLFKKIDRTESANERGQLLTQIARELQLHTKLEEELFYPAMHDAPSKKAEEMVSEALEEHHVVDLVLAELVRHHADEEEKEMFKLADTLDKEELAELAEQMRARADELKGMGRRAA